MDPYHYRTTLKIDSKDVDALEYLNSDDFHQHLVCDIDMMERRLHVFSNFYRLRKP
jgi:hypothetical protein